MACEHGETCQGHPNVFDKLMRGREVTSPHVPGGHVYEPASSLIQGDGFYHEGKSWVVKDIRDHDRGRTVVVEPRAGHVGRTVMSEMQFGTSGITLEDTDERAFTFHPGQVIPRRG
jgi:hypothetical protein